jgi:hypothetical protein
VGRWRVAMATSMRRQTQPTIDDDDDASAGDVNIDVDVDIFNTDAKRKKDLHQMSGKLRSVMKKPPSFFQTLGSKLGIRGG